MNWWILGPIVYIVLFLLACALWWRMMNGRKQPRKNAPLDPSQAEPEAAPDLDSALVTLIAEGLIHGYDVHPVFDGGRHPVSVVIRRRPDGLTMSTEDSVANLLQLGDGLWTQIDKDFAAYAARLASS